MRFYAVILAYAVAIATIVGAGAAAIGDLQQAGARQQRELDASIDQIVQAHNERKALAGKPDEAKVASQTVGAAPQGSPLTRSEAVPQPPPRKSEPAVELNTREVRVAAAKPRRHEGRVRTARRHYVPFNFLSLPKFAGFNLFGLKN
ncbi:MAG TPA: hypothetical protein VFB45_01620 [Pseudolabrys sp.]|nr:hypothetical protein [Pseudolabrys sp.]